MWNIFGRSTEHDDTAATDGQGPSHTMAFENAMAAVAEPREAFSENAASENTASEHTTSERTTSENAYSENTTSENAASENAASENPEPQDAESKDTESKDTESKDTGSKDAELKDAELKDAVPNDAESKDAVPKDAESKDTESESLAAEVVTPKTVTFREATPDVSMVDYDTQREIKKRTGIFVKKTTPLPNRAEIAAAVERENAHAANKQHLVAAVGDGWYTPSGIEHDSKQWALSMAGPLNNRALPAGLEAQRVIKALEAKGGPLSEKNKASIWQHHTKNDGAFELIREYGAGRREVPILGYNRLVEEMNALRYDNTVEEARLRIKLRAAEKRAKDYIRNLPRVQDHSKMRGLLDSVIGSFQRELEQYEAAATKLHEPTYLRPGQMGNDSEEDREGPEPEDGAIFYGDFDFKTVSLRYLVKQLTSMTTALRNMDAAAEELPPDSKEAEGHEAATRSHVDRTEVVVNMLSQESHIRFSNFMASPDQHDPKVDEVERHRRHAVIEVSRTSLQILCQQIKSAASHVENSRYAALAAVDCVTVKADDLPRPGYDASMVGIGMVPMKDLEHERRRNVHLERRLNAMRSKVRKLERAETYRGQKDEQNLYRSIDAYRLFVAQFLRDNIQDDRKSLDAQAAILGTVLDDVRRIESAIRMSTEPTSQDGDLLATLRRIRTGLIPMQETMTEVRQSLTSVTENLEQDCADENGLDSERWKQAGDITSMQAKNDEISRLKHELEQQKKLQMAAEDTEGITAMLKAGELERARIKQLEKKLATNNEIQRALTERATSAEKQVEKLTDSLKERTQFIETIKVPEATLAKWLHETTVALEEANARALRAEEKVKALETASKASSVAPSKSSSVPPSRESSVTAIEPGSQGEGGGQGEGEGQSESEVISQLRAEAEQLRSDLESKQRKLNQAHNTIRESMRKAGIEAREERDRINEAAEKELRRLREELLAAKEQKRHLEATVADAKWNLKTMESLKRENEDLKKKKTGSGSNADAELQKQLVAAQTAYREAKDECAAVRNQLRAAQQIADACKMSEDVAAAGFAKAENINMQLKDKVGHLRGELAMLQILRDSSDNEAIWTSYDDQWRRERAARVSDRVKNAINRAKKRLEKPVEGAKVPIRLLLCRGRRDMDSNDNAAGYQSEWGRASRPMVQQLVQRRCNVLLALQEHKVEHAQWAVKELQTWFQDIDRKYEWLNHRTWMESHGSILILKAYVAAETAWDARRTRDPERNWLELALTAHDQLETALNAHREARSRRHVDEKPTSGHEDDLRWMKVAIKAARLIAMVHERRAKDATKKAKDEKRQQKRKQGDGVEEEEDEELYKLKLDAATLLTWLEAEFVAGNNGVPAPPEVDEPDEQELLEDVIAASPRSRLSAADEEGDEDDEEELTPRNRDSFELGAGPTVTTNWQSLDAELQESGDGSDDGHGGPAEGSENGSEREGPR